MSEFSHRFKTDWGVFTFYFNGIFTVEGIRYHISTIDRDRKVIMFYMELIENNWKIVNPGNYPSWVLELQTKFSDAIKANNHN